jgi:F-type H+-transporting ATPase subunit b
VIPLEAGPPAGILDLNASFWIELVAFLLMLGFLARYAYPRIISAAEGRQRQIAAQLEAAETARREAEEKLAEAEARLQDARNQAQEVIGAAARSADQIREQRRREAAEEARRLIEQARAEIEAERGKALASARQALADMVVAATEKVVGEALDVSAHRRLIDEAIKEVGGNGRSQG